MKKLVFVIFLSFLFQSAHALVSPLNQSILELRSILESQELQEYLSQSLPIMAIEKMGNGYILSTQGLQIQVEVQYLPVSMPGKQPFKLVFHKP